MSENCALTSSTPIHLALQLVFLVLIFLSPRENDSSLLHEEQEVKDEILVVPIGLWFKVNLVERMVDDSTDMFTPDIGEV